MDDKIFEERMNSLKSSYEKLQPVSSVDHIINNVKQTELPKRKKIFPLTYVASFIGVLLIAGILGTQLISQSNKSSGEKSPSIENQTVSATDIEDSINEVRGLYERNLDVLKEKLQFDDVEQYSFVQEAKNSVESFEERREYSSRAELQNYTENVKNIISLRVSMPNEEMEILKERAKNDKKIDETQLISYLIKIELLKERFNEKWFNLRQLPTEGNLVEYVDKLNKQEVENGSDDYLNLIKTLRENGYRFIFITEGEGQIDLTIDHQKILDTFKDMLSNQLIAYLQYKKEVIEQGTVLGLTQEQLASRIIKLEETIIAHPNFEKNDDLKMEYEKHLLHFIQYSDEESMNDFVSDYPKSLSAKQVDEFLNGNEHDEFVSGQERESISAKISPELKAISGNNVQLLPLTDSLEAVYEEYKNTRNDEILEGPFLGTESAIEVSIARLYMYAVENKDYETAFYLTYDGEASERPDLERFISEMAQSTTNYQDLSNKVIKVSTTYKENGRLIEHTFTTKDGESIIFNMKRNNEYEKVRVEYTSFP
ncbi:hypothetical protein FS935_10245 [Metabacillus litoralis]|uniref:Uncharacterized protein n=1 Tax=Metabacillus litoralis TaxID=152268 RepID=A0A5C6W1P1_9BACI|nr:hypothetical protein [Metabacillus litoralis]TXC91266.1 hypothetical protein FS935_10245 [Metabacillus litoralis]